MGFHVHTLLPVTTDDSKAGGGRLGDYEGFANAGSTARDGNLHPADPRPDPVSLSGCTQARMTEATRRDVANLPGPDFRIFFRAASLLNSSLDLEVVLR